MLSLDGLSPKAAPSIWSLDSGYRSGSLFNTSLEELALSQPYGAQSNPNNAYLQSPIEECSDEGFDRAWNNRAVSRRHAQTEESTIDPIVTRLSNFTTKDSFDGDDYLPELKRDGGSCLTCEFWKITNPNENTKCEDCRIPEIVEPALLVLTSGIPQAKELFPSRRNSKRSTWQALDTTHPATRCSACELSALIDPLSPSTCQSCSSNLSLLSPLSSPSFNHKVRRSRAGRNSKLPLRALNQLQAWLDAHHDNPYPSAEVKRQLAQECGITEKQINTWFTNARARQLSPLETYLSSGSEDGADESDIASAADTPVYATGLNYLTENHATGNRKRAGSVSGSSAFSTGNVRPQPSRRGKKKNYRRTNQPIPITEVSPTLSSPVNQARGNNVTIDQDLWQCTFCHRHLVPKSWRRHEETQHRPKAEWTCMLYGPRLLRSPSLSQCAFCMERNPGEDHFAKSHRIVECSGRPLKERTFYRPDHLRQHVKNFHGATLFDIVQGRWKRASEGAEKGWRCGFCGEWLENWNARETHIAGHFKDGKTMEAWMDPEVWEKQQNIKEEIVDVAIGKEKGKKQKPKEGKEKESGLRRLSRTLTRRSTRKFDAPEPPHSQPTSLFANTFAPIPTSMPPMSTPLSYPPELCYSAPPELPEINLDPFLNMVDGSGNVFDWSQIHTSNGSMELGLGMSMAPETQFGSAAYDPAFQGVVDEYGNIVDHQGLGNGYGWGHH